MGLLLIDEETMAKVQINRNLKRTSTSYPSSSVLWTWTKITVSFLFLCDTGYKQQNVTYSRKDSKHNETDDEGTVQSEDQVGAL